MKKTNALLLVIIILLLISIIALIIVFANTNNKNQPVQEPLKTEEPVLVDWQGIYGDFLLKQPYVYYARIADLNFNGTPELLLSYTGASASAALNIYEIIDGKMELRSGYEEPEHINNSLAGTNYHLKNTAPPNSLPLYFPYDLYDEEILKYNPKTDEYSYFWKSNNGADTESFQTIAFFKSDSPSVEIETYFYEDETFDFEGEFEKGEYIYNDKSYSKEEYAALKSGYLSQWENVYDYPAAVCGINLGRENVPDNFIYLGDDGKITERDIEKLFENYVSETEFIKNK